MDLLQTSQVVELLNDTDTNWCVDFMRLSFTSWKTIVHHSIEYHGRNEHEEILPGFDLKTDFSHSKSNVLHFSINTSCLLALQILLPDATSE